MGLEYGDMNVTLSFLMVVYSEGPMGLILWHMQ